MPQTSSRYFCDCADCLEASLARLPVIDRPTSQSQQIIRGDRQQASPVYHRSLGGDSVAPQFTHLTTISPQPLPPDSPSSFMRSILLTTYFYEVFGPGPFSSPMYVICHFPLRAYLMGACDSSNIVTVRPSTHEPSRSGRANDIRARVPILQISHWLPITSHDGLTFAWICDIPQPSTSAHGRGNRGVLTCRNCG